MFETALIAFTTLFAVIGPIDVAVIYAGITTGIPARDRTRFAIRGTLIATGVLAFFAVFGQAILNKLGISLASLRIAGGILLLLIAIDMVFAKHSGGTGTTEAEEAEARKSSDPSVFPLATPLIAGPGAIGAIIVLIGDAQGDPNTILAVTGALAVILTLQLGLLLTASQVQKFLGRTGSDVVARIMGVLLAALAVEFILTGIRISGLLQEWMPVAR